MKYTTKWRCLASASVVAVSGLSEGAVVSVNFRESTGHANQLIASSTVAGGGAGVSASNWNDAAGSTGSLSDLNDDTGSTTTLDLSWSSGGAWGDGSANTDANNGIGNAQLQRGYLDDGQDGPDADTAFDPIQIVISSAPYALFDVVVYFSTDTTGDNYGTITVTDGVGTGTASTSGTKQTWGLSPALDGTNTLRVSGLTGTVTLDVPARIGAVRHSVSGIQIIQVPEPSTFLLVGMAGLGLFRRRR